MYQRIHERIRFFSFFILLFCPFLLFAGKHKIIGPDVFLVSDSIIVGQDDTLTILPGTILKFELQKFMKVGGFLQALGTASKPIHFTSFLDDTKGGDSDKDGGRDTPIPGEWGPVLFSQYSRVCLSHVVFSFLGGPFKVQSSFAEIDTCNFNNCSFNYFSGRDKTLNVQGVDISYRFDEKQLPAVPPVVTVPKSVSPKKKNYFDRRIFIGGFSVIALASGVYFANDAMNNKNIYNNYRPGNTEYDAADTDTRNARFESLRSDIKFYGGIGGGLAAAGLAGLSYVVVYTIRF